MSWKKYSHVPCPKCRAPAGAKCTTKDGKPRDYDVHAKRVSACMSYFRALLLTKQGQP